MANNAATAPNFTPNRKQLDQANMITHVQRMPTDVKNPISSPKNVIDENPHTSTHLHVHASFQISEQYVTQTCKKYTVTQSNLFMNLSHNLPIVDVSPF